MRDERADWDDRLSEKMTELERQDTADMGRLFYPAGRDEYVARLHGSDRLNARSANRLSAIIWAAIILSAGAFFLWP